MLRSPQAMTHLPFWVSDFSHEGGLKTVPAVRTEEEVTGEKWGWVVTAVCTLCVRRSRAPQRWGIGTQVVTALHCGKLGGCLEEVVWVLDSSRELGAL